MNPKKNSEIYGASILILGYGREGKSVHAWLAKQYPRLNISVADSATDGEQYLQHIDTYDTVIRSPGVPPYLPELVRYRKAGGHVTSSTNIFFSLVSGTVIGVTGTKGKSTTSSLIAHILSRAFDDVRLVGNIGVPMLDHLEGANKETLFVIELSSHQLEDLRYSPHVAVILNIVPEHLDYYPDFETYKAAKANIVKFQHTKDTVIYHPAASDVAQLSLGKKVPFELFSTVSSKLLGNKENIMAAMTVAHVFGVSDSNVIDALASFPPLPHRLESVGEYKGIQFYNDSLSTIPEAAIHAVESLGLSVQTLIAGGYNRGLDYTKLGTFLSTSSIKTLILFPDTGRLIWEAVPKEDQQRFVKYDVNDMEEAVRLAYEVTGMGKICLLSPAAASYNLFRDYADRGDQFKKYVKAMGDHA